MRICCISDLHGQTPPEIEPCDLLLIAGDIGPDDPKDAADYFRRVIYRWLEQVPARHTVAVVGNHDFLARSDPRFLDKLPWTVLYNSHTVFDDFVIFGSPMTPTFGDWAFMADESELAKVWAEIHERTDILLVHGPPAGVLDLNIEGVHSGSTSLRTRIDELPQLKLISCGRIHEAYGIDRIGDTTIVNASLLNEEYEQVNDPIVVDL